MDTVFLGQMGPSHWNPHHLDDSEFGIPPSSRAESCPDEGRGGEGEVKETGGGEGDAKVLLALILMPFSRSSWDLQNSLSLSLERNIAKRTSQHLNSSLAIEPMISADAGKRHAFEDGSPEAEHRYGMCLGAELSFREMDINSKMPSNPAEGL